MGRDRLTHREVLPMGRLALAFWIAMLAVAGSTRGGLFRPTEFRTSAAGLAITGDPYGRSIPRTELRLDLARVIDLDREPAFRPWIKLNGIGLPHHRSGWHRLHNHEKALVFLSGSRRAVLLPTTRGYTVLISPDDPERFLDNLRNPSPSGRVFELAPGH